MRRLAVELLRRDKQMKIGATNNRLKAERNLDDLLSVLLGNRMTR